MRIELTGDSGSLIGQRQERLSDAVEGLYEVFARYKLQKEVPGCDCCVFPEDNALIHSRPLRKLSAKDLEKYSQKAMTTWGDQNDFRHFLPRLFELFDDFHAESTDIEIISGKLRYAHWRKWPADQQRAVERFLSAYWERVLAEYPVGGATGRVMDADEALCMVAQALDDVTPLLEFWVKEESPPAVCHLAEFINDAGNCYCQDGGLGSAFWGDRREQVKQVGQWLESKRLYDRIERLFYVYETTPPDLAAALSAAMQVLEAVQRKAG